MILQGCGIPARKDNPMSLIFLRAQGHDYQTGTFLFFMADGATEVQCGVSDSAMDDAEKARNVRENQRGDEFARLQERITTCAAQKYSEGHLEAGPSRILVRSIDLMPRK